MKIVVLDGYAGNPGDLSWDELRKLGDLTIYDRTPSDRKTILERIGDAELVFTNKTPLSAAIFAACPSRSSWAFWPPATTSWTLTPPRHTAW